MIKFKPIGSFIFGGNKRDHERREQLFQNYPGIALTLHQILHTVSVS